MSNFRNSYMQLLFSFLGIIPWSLSVVSAEAADVDFTGKTVKIVVSSSAGGGTDTAARLIARFLPKHLPGHPAVIVQNIPAGGGLLANNYFYRQGKPNGLDLFQDSSGGITAFNRGGSRVKYNPREFIYVGSIVRGGSIVMIRKDARDRFTDSTAKPLVVGDPDGTRTWLATCLWGKEYLGWNLRFIVGYAGTAELALALRQGEIDMWATANDRLISDLLRDGIVEIVAQAPMERRKDFPKIPTFAEVLGNKRPSGVSWQAYRVWSAPNEVDKPLSLPPGTPDNIVRVYREAFLKLPKDPEFVREANKFFGAVWNLRGGDATKELVLEATSISKEVAEFMNEMRRKNGLPVPKS